MLNAELRMLNFYLFNIQRSAFSVSYVVLAVLPSHLTVRPSLTETIASRQGSVELNPVSTSQIGFWRDFMESRKLRTCRCVAEPNDESAISDMPEGSRNFLASIGGGGGGALGFCPRPRPPPVGRYGLAS